MQNADGKINSRWPHGDVVVVCEMKGFDKTCKSSLCSIKCKLKDGLVGDFCAVFYCSLTGVYKQQQKQISNGFLKSTVYQNVK